MELYDNKHQFHHPKPTKMPVWFHQTLIPDRYVEDSAMCKAAKYFLNDKEAFLTFTRNGLAPTDNSGKDRQALCPGKAELPLRQGKQRRRLLRRRHDDDRERKEQRIGASLLHEVGPFGCLQRQCGPHVRQSGSAGLGAFGLQKEGTQEQDAVLCQIKQSKKRNHLTMVAHKASGVK